MIMFYSLLQAVAVAGEPEVSGHLSRADADFSAE
jgi:hypothetical protein